jgi:alginate O-acetyltransferase complex protein AlgI
MLFNSLEFLIFFPTVVALFFLTPHRFRWSVLLTASCFFYMFFRPVYILILFFTIAVDYVAAILIENASTWRRKRAFLLLSIVVNVLVLAVFKYFNFLNYNAKGLAAVFGIEYSVTWDIVLPIGLSFHTFQAMSYTIEVYRGAQPAERRPGIFALYVMFFPQLVAGPIERPQNLLHQFDEPRRLDWALVLNGVNFIAYGLFKKIVVADRLAVYVNAVYGDLANASTISVMLAVLFFSIQIYCDFSGYSDIAIGTARIMGFRLMQNFNRPYLSASISEFWTRWHISLSTWFRDYLYVPLGGNRVGTQRWYANLMIVFLVSGLWHGASWTFVAWGALHGIFLVVGIMTRDLRLRLKQRLGVTRVPRLDRAIGIATTFTLVSLAWIGFRAGSAEDALTVLRRLAELDLTVNIAQITAAQGPLNLLLSFAAIGLLLGSYRLPQSLQIRWNSTFLVSAALLIILLGPDGKAPFIYFQF